MIVTKEVYEALLEHQRNYIPCAGVHQWVQDEDEEDQQYCANCMVIKEQHRTGATT